MESAMVAGKQLSVIQEGVLYVRKDKFIQLYFT